MQPEFFSVLFQTIGPQIVGQCLEETDIHQISDRSRHIGITIQQFLLHLQIFLFIGDRRNLLIYFQLLCLVGYISRWNIRVHPDPHRRLEGRTYRRVLQLFHRFSQELTI